MEMQCVVAGLLRGESRGSGTRADLRTLAQAYVRRPLRAEVSADPAAARAHAVPLAQGDDSAAVEREARLVAEHRRGGGRGARAEVLFPCEGPPGAPIALAHLQQREAERARRRADGRTERGKRGAQPLGLQRLDL